MTGGTFGERARAHVPCSATPADRYQGSRQIPLRRCAMRKKVLVLGTNFAGLTAALALGFYALLNLFG